MKYQRLKRVKYLLFGLSILSWQILNIDFGLGQTIRNFCPAAKSIVTEDADLYHAVEVTFGRPFFTTGVGDSGAECIFPLKVLRYGTADVLLAIGNKPFDSCHGCGARMSAYFLRRGSGELKLVGRHLDFSESGTWGNPGQIYLIKLATHDGIIVESGGTFQGYTVARLNIYVFRGGRALHLTPPSGLLISSSNAGATTERNKVVSVSGSWTIGARGNSIVIDYVRRSGGGHESRAPSGFCWVRSSFSKAALK